MSDHKDQARVFTQNAHAWSDHAPIIAHIPNLVAYDFRFQCLNPNLSRAVLLVVRTRCWLVKSVQFPISHIPSGTSAARAARKESGREEIAHGSGVFGLCAVPWIPWNPDMHQLDRLEPFIYGDISWQIPGTNLDIINHWSHF